MRVQKGRGYFWRVHLRQGARHCKPLPLTAAQGVRRALLEAGQTHHIQAVVHHHADVALRQVVPAQDAALGSGASARLQMQFERNLTDGGGCSSAPFHAAAIAAGTGPE